MFAGHFAVAFAAKKAAPKVSLGTMIMAGQFVDLLWPIFLITGIEHVRVDPGNTALTPLDFYDYPITHSFAGALGWSFLLGIIFYLIRRNWKNSAVVSLVCLSHWFLDLLTHRPDLPLWFSGGIKVGFGLWNSIVWTLAVELLLFIAGVFLYFNTTKSKDKTGTLGAWGLVLFVLLIYLANVFGPPPPKVEVIGAVGNASWLFVLWGYWIDRHRELK